jgi:hypothetical protein
VNTVLNFSRIIRRETAHYWEFRRKRSKECLAEYERNENHAHYWALAGEVEVTFRFNKASGLMVMKTVVEQIRKTCEPVRSNVLSYVQDEMCRLDFRWLYRYFVEFLITPMEGVRRETYLEIGKALCMSTTLLFDCKMRDSPDLLRLEDVVKQTSALYRWSIF